MSKSRQSPAERAKLLKAAAAKRILVIDDDVTVLRSIERTLKQAHHVRLFASALDALDALAKDPTVDLILCDLMMPVMSGIEFYEALSRRGSGLERKVVFLTGGAFTAEAEAFLAKRPRLEKPFNIKTLREMVAAFIAGLR